MLKTLEDQEIPSDYFTSADIIKAIEELNMNKSPDEFGLCAEHLKFSKNEIAPYLTKLFNNIIETLKTPGTFKTGILFPVLKKDKDPSDVNSYRGITVTPVIGKVFEYCILPKLNLQNITNLQFGFTKGLNPLISSFIISESKYDQTRKNNEFYMGFLDVKSAFDVVQHDIILDKLLDLNIPSFLWLVIKDLYSNLSTKVKWQGDLSEKFSVHQGVRQGGILSTHLYKIFVQDLLLELERNSLGLNTGNIFVGTPTCADDMAFIETNRDNLQIMLNVSERYSKQHHYKIHPTKTKIVTCGKVTNADWTLYDTPVTISKEATHLGITRSWKKEGEINVANRIKLARRTLYALMGSGVHGTNGLDPVTSYKIYNTYVLPRLLYGLEAIPLNKTNISQLESFHRKNLRHFQSLPQRTAIAAIYLLIGGLPIEAELHKKQLSFLHNLLSSNVQRVDDIIIRQMSVNYDNPNSFFSKIREILLKYGLPPIHLLQETLPSKLKWKSLVTKHLNTYWQNTLRDDAESKSTLKHMDTEHLLVGKNHPVWTIFDKTKAEVRKAIIKARIVSGTFILNSDRAKFNQAPSSVCQLCNLSEENISHFLLECPILSNTRITYFQPIKTYVTQHITAEVWHSVFQSKSNIIRLIIDCRHFSQTLRDDKIMNMIETKTREMCYKLYIKRLKLLEAMDG
ncbi:Hypothetical predicted protein [Mytilus galloprovincialis]|uniref:Reverse transcriptase domain-containing protein n=1 Tax=Mytilus galloprovincialis TaxID=29158 RepID=A0A8B6DUR1_MYTGA|nr:Hypothetical predicted protein [Mytilus galloprovincialis]